MGRSPEDSDVTKFPVEKSLEPYILRNFLKSLRPFDFAGFIGI